MRQHLNLIVTVLHAADRWPPSFPFLVDAARADRYETIQELAQDLDDGTHRHLQRRVKEHAEWVTSREGRRDLGGGLVRLELVMGAAWREVLTPRITADGTTVAVRLVEAMRQGAIVMWRTYADDMPDEAAAITILALADLQSAAGLAQAPWTLMLDEFGAVIHMAAARAVASLQRARSHHGQVIVITQSAADIEALSQQPGLLSSLSDNFTAFVAHRQTAPETRGWLAKLMGTRAAVKRSYTRRSDPTPGAQRSFPLAYHRGNHKQSPQTSGIPARSRCIRRAPSPLHVAARPPSENST